MNHDLFVRCFVLPGAPAAQKGAPQVENPHAALPQAASGVLNAGLQTDTAQTAGPRTGERQPSALRENTRLRTGRRQEETIRQTEPPAADPRTTESPTNFESQTIVEPRDTSAGRSRPLAAQRSVPAADVARPVTSRPAPGSEPPTIPQPAIPLPAGRTDRLSSDTLAAGIDSLDRSASKRDSARSSRPMPEPRHGATPAVAGTPPVPHRDAAPDRTDTTGLTCDRVFSAADTLRTAASAPYRNVTPEEFFGEASFLVRPSEPLPSREAPSAAYDPFFQIFVLLLTALYARFVYLNLDDLRQLFTRLTKDSLSGKQRLFADQSVGYSRFLNAAWAVGLPYAGALALKLGAQWLPDTLPRGGGFVVSLAVAVFLLLLALVQFGALSLAGSVTLTRAFTGQLIHLRRTYFAAALLAAAPVCSLYILCEEGRGEAFLYLLAGVGIIISILYLKESLTLFISKKIPILHWFLYLCAVECLPVSFIILTALRQ